MLIPFNKMGLPPHYYIQYVERSNASSVEKAARIAEMLSITWERMYPNEDRCLDNGPSFKPRL